MAAIVSAYATSHILFSPKGVEERARRVVDGMKELGRRAAAARADVLLLIVSDHMFNINLAIQPPFTVGVSDTYAPFGDMAIPVRPFPGHREFAAELVRHAAARGFDLATAEELIPDHGVTLPLLFLKPWGSVPVVPLYVNVNMDP
ncbi:MAG: AmmeMemoRadiSam system protein B, partial [Candidatus Binatia bacterium]